MISNIAAVVAAVSSMGLGRILLPEEPVIVTGGALALGFLTRTVIDNKRKKHPKRTDRSDIFPHLKLNALEKWGTKWGKEYEHIEKVVLFDPPFKYPLDVQYILYFNFDTSTPEGKKSEKNFNKINAFQNNDILGSGFQEVYRSEPNPGFRLEWFVTIVKYAGFNDNYSWVAYERGKPE